MASLLNRPYDTTVPWNVPTVPFPVEVPNSFPKIDDISPDFVCKRTKNAVIAGEEGDFYGPVNITTGIPQGCGVFVAGPWVHCGSVLNGDVAEGKRVSVNRETKEMRLVNTKF